MRLRNLIWSVFQPDIRTPGELRAFVLDVTILCGTLAIAVDVAKQLIFFISWERSVWSWILSGFTGCAIAAPVSFAIARVHLELYRAKHAVEELSRTDPLTGLLNRRALLEQFEVAPPGILAFAIADIDRFKVVNDTHGHFAGDKAIRMVGQIMQAELGTLGRIGRIGGEEFALVAVSGDMDRLVQRLWDFRDRIASTPVVAGPASFRVTISIGVAECNNCASFDELFAEADRALYLAKASGRNRVVAAAELQAAEPSAAVDDAPLERRTHRVAV